MPRESRKSDSESSQAAAPRDSLPAVDADLAALALRARLQMPSGAFRECFAPWRSVRLPDAKGSHADDCSSNPVRVTSEPCALHGSNKFVSVTLHLLPQDFVDKACFSDDSAIAVTRSRRFARAVRHVHLRAAKVAACLIAAAACAAFGVIPLLSWTAFWALSADDVWPYLCVMLTSGLVGSLVSVLAACLAGDLLRWAGNAIVGPGEELAAAPAAAELVLTKREWRLRRQQVPHWQAPP